MSTCTDIKYGKLLNLIIYHLKTAYYEQNAIKFSSFDKSYNKEYIM